MSLVADGVGFHIDKGYIYAAMGFAVLVEAVNIISKQRKLAAARLAGGEHTPVAHVTGATTHHKVTEAAETAVAPKPRRTAATRAQSRPKSAPRKKTT